MECYDSGECNSGVVDDRILFDLRSRCLWILNNFSLILLIGHVKINWGFGKWRKWLWF